MAQIGSFAARAEQAGFASVGVIDRLVYDNLDPLIALAAAAARTSRIGLISTVVNVNWRAHPRLLAKQISSVVRVSGGRFTAGLGMGGWPAFQPAPAPVTWTRSSGSARPRGRPPRFLTPEISWIYRSLPVP
jgi:alkanesulfonate monooxygenase SsuD/methylene tetrahydromethanopterin reductase-like flavin-dependent oxidoreductase (luciferase family)